MKLVGVNHRVYSADLLRQAIAGAETEPAAIELLTLTDGYFAEFSVDYHGGLHSPHLARITGKADLLTPILLRGDPRNIDARIS